MKKLLFAIFAIAILGACSKDESSASTTPSEPEVQALLGGGSAPCYDPTAVDPVRNCPAVLDPVCACGIITFPNNCFAEAAGFVNTTPGECDLAANCVLPVLPGVLADLNANDCAAVYQPVCGCDGNTYSNSCAAITSGVIAFVPGECGNVGGGTPLDDLTLVTP